MGGHHGYSCRGNGRSKHGGKTKKRKRETTSPGSIPSPNQMTRHHLVPKSRIPYEHRGSKGHENIRKVVRWRHEAWHNVFGNKTPIEVVDMLWRLAPAGYFETFDVSMSWWGQRVSLSLESHEQTEFMADWGDKKFLAWKALFGSRSLVLVLAEVLREWAPDGYFTRYSIVAYDSGAWYKVRHF